MCNADCCIFTSLFVKKRPNKRHSTHKFKCKGSNFLSTACSTLPIAISFKLRPRRINFSHRFIEFPDLACGKCRKQWKYYKESVSKQTLEYRHFLFFNCERFSPFFFYFELLFYSYLIFFVDIMYTAHMHHSEMNVLLFNIAFRARYFFH